MEPDQNTGVGSENTGVTPGTHEDEDEPMGAEPEESTGVDTEWPTEDDHESSDEEGDNKTSHQDGDEPPINHEMDERYGA